MSIDLASLVIRHERRIRLLFTNTLDASAFTTLTTYDIDNQDGLGVTPNVVAALLVPNAPNAVDLQLDQDLVGGALYLVSAVGVVASDATVTPAGSTQLVRWGTEPDEDNEERPQQDLRALVYGVDLVWTGADMLETPSGDLATIDGIANVQGALMRRLTDEYGLPWRRDYNAKASENVNAPQHNATTLRGSLIRKANADDRVKSTTAKFNFDDDAPGDAFFDVEITLIGAGEADQVALNVPAT